MKTINNLLDIAKEQNKLTSDRKLAAALNTGNMPRYRKGHDVPSDQVAMRLAKLCNLKPEMVIAICHAAKAKTKEEKNIWKHFYKMAAAAAVTGLVVSGGVSVVGSHADKAQSVALSQIENAESNAMDIMSSLASLLASIFCPQRIVRLA